MEPHKELAIITQVSYGYTDNGVGMLFGLQLLEGATVLFMDVSDVTSFLGATKLNNIMNLVGRPCAVNIDENKVVSFDKLI